MPLHAWLLIGWFIVVSATILWQHWGPLMAAVREDLKAHKRARRLK